MLYHPTGRSPFVMPHFRSFQPILLAQITERLSGPDISTDEFTSCVYNTRPDQIDRPVKINSLPLIVRRLLSIENLQQLHPAEPLPGLPLRQKLLFCVQDVKDRPRTYRCLLWTPSSAMSAALICASNDLIRARVEVNVSHALDICQNRSPRVLKSSRLRPAATLASRSCEYTVPF